MKHPELKSVILKRTIIMMLDVTLEK